MARSKQSRRRRPDYLGLSNPRYDGDGTEWIFESPDGGKTIYKRAIGSDKKILIRESSDDGT